MYITNQINENRSTGNIHHKMNIGNMLFVNLIRINIKQPEIIFDSIVHSMLQ